MYHIHYLNPISPKGTALWTEDYHTTDTLDTADAVLVRSAAMHDLEFGQDLLAIARAGAGVNNIPLEKCAEQGIVVFNTPGANANSVMELALCGMLLGCRDIVGGINWVQSIAGDGDVAKKVEKGKSKFAGHEIRHKSLGVIGLGAIGGPLANAARRLGMNVYGCDPYISIDAAWHLDSHVHRVKTRDEIFEKCDIITLHVPLVDDTRKMINRDAIAKMKDGVIILNNSRGPLVVEQDLADALNSGKVAAAGLDVVSSEPIKGNNPLLKAKNCIITPHISWAPKESRQRIMDCAVANVQAYLAGQPINVVNR